MSDKIKKGKAGEEAAAQFLIRKGYEIVERNFRFRRSEIDLIVKRDNWLVFVEVKTRSSNQFGYPESFVDQKKIKNVLLGAAEYLHQTDWKGNVRYDVVSVSMRSQETEIHHFEDAFH